MIKIPLKQRKSPAYLRWVVKNYPCFLCSLAWENNIACGAPDDTLVPHHLPNPPYTRRYADYKNIVPLCHKHHVGNYGVHQHPKIELETLDAFKKAAKHYTEAYLGRQK